MSENDLLVRASIIDELSGGLATIQAQVDELTVSLEGLEAAGAAAGGAAGAGAGAAGLGATAAGATELKTIAKSTHAEVLSLSAGLNGALAGAAKTALFGVGALGAGLTLLGVKSTETFQSARLGIQTFVGDVTKGNTLFESLKGMQGPFNITNLQDAGQALLVAGTGADHLVPRMKALADIAATQSDPGAALNSLADAIGRIQEMGTLDARTLRPLLTAGVPVYEMLSSELGVPLEQVKKTLATGAPIDLPMRFFADLETEAGPLARFAGAVDKQRSTLRGQFTLIKTDAQTALADVFAPLGDALTQVTPLLRTNLVDLIHGVGPGLTSFLTGVVGLVSALIPVLSPIASALLGALGQVLSALLPALNELAPHMPELATALADLVVALIPLIPPLTELTIALVPVLVSGIGDLTTAITKVIGWVTPLVTGVSHLLETSKVARGVVEGLFFALMAYEAVTKVAGWILGIRDAVLALRGALIALKGAEAVTSVGGAAGVAGGEAAAAAEGGGLIAGAIPLAAGALATAGGAAIVIDASKRKAGAKSSLEMAGGGALAGAGTGAIIGSILPGPGTAAGAVLGGVIGFTAGGIAGALRQHAANQRTAPAVDPNVSRAAANAAYAGAGITVNGPLVQADRLSTDADVRQAALDAYVEIQRQTRERN